MLLKPTYSKITFLRRIIIAANYIHRAAIVIRLPFFLLLLLISTDFHQAVEKTNEAQKVDLKRYLFTESHGIFNQEYLDHVTEKIDNVLTRVGFNGSILISREGQIIYENYRGIADYRNREDTINSDTYFQLASVGKQFTAFAVMTLQELGKFEYDDPVCDYIDDFPYPEITIRQLLNHTSGLQNYMYLLDHYWDKDYYPDNEDLVDLFVEHDLPLNFWPGRRFAYSNSGYAFLALLVEKVSGKPFAEYMQEEVFIPLGMNNTFVYDVNNKEEINNRAYGFSGRSRWRFIPDDCHDGIVGDKGFYSTARDMYRWDQALTYFAPVSRENLLLASSRAVLNNGRTVSYGFGWRLKKVNDYDCIYHHGWWHGFRTVFKRIPEKEVLIVILNNTNSNISGITRRITKIVFPDFDIYPEENLAESL